jgi:hypothetical protein
MTPCFADTFFFLALLVEGDDAHERAVQAIGNLRRQLYTSTWVLMELADAIATTPTRRVFVQFIEFLRSHPKIVIVSATEDMFTRGLELYNDRPDKRWSLTDCTSFVVMRDHGIIESLTGDHHFEQAGFVALLK